MKTKIALDLMTSAFSGGAHQYAQAIARALALLDKDKYEICVHYDSLDWKPFLQNKQFQHFIKIKPKTFSYLQLKLFWYKLINKRKIEKTLRNIRRQAFASYDADIYVSPQMLGLLPQGSKAKQIGVIHDLMHLYEARFEEVGAAYEVEGRQAYFTQLVDEAACALVDSEIGKAHVLESFAKVNAKIEVLPFTVFQDQIPTTAKKPKKDIPEKFFFYPAQFWSHKNHVKLAEALYNSIQSNPQCADMNFVFTGDTSKNGYAAFAQKTKELGIEKHFHTLGYVEPTEIAWLYKNARALIMPTFFGPTNIPPLEAMYLECPVAVSDVYGHKERFEENVLYFNPEDSYSIADALSKLWLNDTLCKELAQKGFEHSKKWTEEDFHKKFLEIIYSI